MIAPPQFLALVTRGHPLPPIAPATAFPGLPGIGMPASREEPDLMLVGHAAQTAGSDGVTVSGVLRLYNRRSGPAGQAGERRPSGLRALPAARRRWLRPAGWRLRIRSRRQGHAAHLCGSRPCREHPALCRAHSLGVRLFDVSAGTPRPAWCGHDARRCAPGGTGRTAPEAPDAHSALSVALAGAAGLVGSRRARRCA